MELLVSVFCLLGSFAFLVNVIQAVTRGTNRQG